MVTIARGPVEIQRLAAGEAEELLPDLTSLLQEAVAGGASLGFLPPLAPVDSAGYWQEVVTALRTTHRSC